MAFCVMESFSRLGKYDLADIAHNFVRWIDEGFWSSADHAFDVGNATYSAVEGIKDGRLKNGTEDSQGNGSIMRFAPGFILAEACNNPDIIAEISDLTHNSRAIRRLLAELRLTCLALIDGDASRLHSTHTRESAPNSGWAFDTVEAATWAFCNHPTFREGMLAAVNLGGDSDSIGAVYGQLAGAYFGCDAIPQEWIHDVKDWQTIDARITDFLKTIDEIRNRK
jgi:ADP-ribosylglycohydrolase